MDHSHLAQLFDAGASSNPLEEILTLCTAIAPDYPLFPVRQVHQELARYFAGKHPDYQSSETKYHNLRHSYSVVLATVRLFHGLSCEGKQFSEDTLTKALYSAYFHDCGLLLKSSETESTGAVFTKEHEARSIVVLERYLEEQDISFSILPDCSLIIQCTNLSVDPDTLTFPSDDIRLASAIVGSADILAQMADRFYLERLPLLFQEHKEGGITSHDSAIELMQHTSYFYHEVIVDRLERVFDNLAQVMRIHFRERWGLDRNLYLENINKNVDYIKIVVQSCEDELEGLQRFLRRTPPA